MVNEVKCEKRDLSRTDLAHMITTLRKELREQIAENKELLKINGELRKENDALITVIDLAKEHLTIKLVRYINEKDYVLDDNDLDEILKILERVNEE